MKKYCNNCKKEFDARKKKCPICDKKLETKYSEEELEAIRKQNDDFTVINTFFM